MAEFCVFVCVRARACRYFSLCTMHIFLASHAHKHYNLFANLFQRRHPNFCNEIFNVCIFAYLARETHWYVRSFFFLSLPFVCITSVNIIKSFSFILFAQLLSEAAKTQIQARSRPRRVPSSASPAQASDKYQWASERKVQ